MVSSNGKNGHLPHTNGNGKGPGSDHRPASPRYAHITGWGMAAPERVMTNDELARLVDTNDEWIQSHTGIKERRIAGPKETTTSLAVSAALRAMEVADIDPEEIELIVVATCTPEYAFPSTACLVQDAIGAANAGAFDLSAACTGFIYALGLAAEAVKSGSIKAALVIGAETLSKVTNWKDRGTCILFGDGAGAFVIQGSEVPGGIRSCIMKADGSGSDLLSLPSVGQVRSSDFGGLIDPTIEMNGREVYRFATKALAAVTQEAVATAGMKLEEVSAIVPHQANKRIIEAAARKLELPDEKFILNLDRYGNTSAASIPMALCEAVNEGRIRRNDNVVFVGFGGGLTWGAAAVQWDVTPPPEMSRWQRLGRQTRYAVLRFNSFSRRTMRRVEGVLFGSESPEGGVEPPHRGSKK
jgi:3-oxoacyl-[acyl-carrier-protein] synthase-3